MNSGRFDWFDRAWFDNEWDGGAMNVCVIGDVARVGTLPAVAVRLHHRPNQFRRGEGRALGSIRAARLWSSRAIHQIEPLGPTTRIELGDGPNAADSQRCNRRDVAYDAAADHTTGPSVSNPAARTNRSGLVHRFLLRSHWD